jgi:hypothetical protein
MSDNFNQEDRPASFVPEVSEYSSSDNIQEMKSGIFNIFISLYNHMTVKVGPVEAMKYCIMYLQEIINNCQEALDDQK